jgi:hypothetical protein
MYGLLHCLDIAYVDALESIATQKKCIPTIFQWGGAAFLMKKKKTIAPTRSKKHNWRKDDDLHSTQENKNRQKKKKRKKSHIYLANSEPCHTTRAG